MAVGNSVAAAAGGADFISTTVNGLGERAGNCATEELYFALKYSLNIDCARDLSVINNLCERVAVASKRPVPPAKPITGAMVYKHESGIHVDCLIKNIHSYQLVEPQESGGGKVEFIIGRHSGRNAVKAFFAGRNIVLSEPEAAVLLAIVKEYSGIFGRGLEPR